MLWCDNANVIRGKAIHFGALADHFEHGVSLLVAQQALLVVADVVKVQI